MARKIIRNYLLFNFLFYFSMSFCHPVYVLFLRDNGMSMAEIGIVNFTFMIGMFIFEVPTGVIADFFGRKISVIAGVFTISLSFFLYFSSHSLFGFMLSEFIMAFGASMISGALDAWVKDSLDVNGFNGKISKVFSTGELTTRVAGLVSGGIGGVIGVYSLRWPWFVSGVNMLICGIVSVFLLEENYFQKQADGWKHSLNRMKVIMKESVEYGYQNKRVWRLIMFNTLIALAAQPINMQWTLVFEPKIGRSVVVLGFVGIQLALIFGIIFSINLINRGKSETGILCVATLIAGVSILLSALSPWTMVMLIAFCTHESGRGMLSPIQRAILQENIPSNKRATIGSFDSMVTKVGAAGGWLISGIAADYIGFTNCWIASSVLSILAVLVVKKIGATS